MRWSSDQLWQALGRYEQECIDAGMRPNAIHSYWDYARRFLAWRQGDYTPRGEQVRPKSTPPPATVADLTADARDYVREVEVAGRRQQTIDTYHRHAMFFIRWLAGDFQPGRRLTGEPPRDSPWTARYPLRDVDEVAVQDRRMGSRIGVDDTGRGAGETTPNLTTQAAWAIATQAKTDKPCADCGEIYPYWVMQLDHVPGRGAKAFTISLTYTSGRDRRVLCTREQFLDEIAKCDIVCANCHAARTHARGGQRWGRTDGRP